MENKHIIKAGILSVFLVLTFLISYEMYWRYHDFPVSYNDNESLWTHKRKMVYDAPESATVFIGSSRVKFDVDIETWEELTGEKAIQLAFVGTSPKTVLDDLANDENFKGKLIIGVTDGLFFTTHPYPKHYHYRAQNALDFYKKFSPSQLASFHINKFLESKLVFLDERYAVNSSLDKLKIPNREGVRGNPLFPDEFGLTTFERQDYMSEKFLSDTLLQRRQKDIWTMFGMTAKAPGVGGDTLQSIFSSTSASVAKIKERGGQVIFVRPPSSGPLLIAEKENYPREKYWDKLLEVTNTEGVHFADYPETSNFDCPEWSHLSSSDSKIYTKHLVDILRNEKGWSFLKPSKSLSSLPSKY